MSTKPVTDVTDAPGGEIPEEVVERAWAGWIAYVDERHRDAFGTPISPISDVDKKRQMACVRAALSAAGVGKLVEALGAAPIFSKYHTGSGFDYIRFADDYHAWKKQARSALSSYTGTRT